MATDTEYAQFSGRVYKEAFIENRTPIPIGWKEEYWMPDTATGFSGGIYRNLQSGEVVVAFTGTNEQRWADFSFANIPLAIGLPSPQIELAVRLYYRAINEYGADPAQITFTGHSLGGGLASLMGVFFNKASKVFDPAPFGVSATSVAVLESVSASLQTLGVTDSDFESCIMRSNAGSQLWPRTNVIEQRKLGVTGTYLKGDFLEYLRAVNLTAVGALPATPSGNTSLGMIDLHSMTLLGAYLTSPLFGQVAGKLSDLLPAIFDANLFNRENEKNLLAHLYRHQTGVDSNTPEAPGIVPSDAMLTRFALDFQQLADLNPGASDATIVRILTEIGLQHYYQQNTTNEYVFQALGNGIQFDLTQPLGDTDTALSQIKGYDKLCTWAQQQAGAEVAGSEEENPLNALRPLLDTKHRWNVGIGNMGMNGRGDGEAADILIGGKNSELFDAGGGDDLLIGGAGGDILKGGAGDDLLYGGSGEDRLDGGDDADKLYGGAGRDVLLGGAGNDTLRGGRDPGDYLVGGAGDDTYIYKSEDQADLIYDEDGQGHIEYDGMTLAGGTGKGKNSRVFFDNPDAPDTTYVVSGDMTTGPVTLTIKRAKGDGQLTVFDFYDGDLGIHLEDGEDQPPKAPRPPTPQQNPGNPGRGDPLVIDLAGTGIQTYGLDRNLHFDHDNDGFAEQTGWIAPGAGVLVLDANSDDTLNNGQELFGDFTRLPGGQLAANGFAALSQHDRNRDGRIDAADPIWSSLKVAVWETGPRGNPVLGDPAAAMSLRTLDELGIESIGLDSAIVTATDENGNTRTRSGQITLNDGATRQIAEYRFARDNAETRFLDWRALPETIAVLPELTLGGVQMDLTQALVRDAQEGWLGQPPGSLRAKLDAFLAETAITTEHASNSDWRQAA